MELNNLQGSEKKVLWNVSMIHEKRLNLLDEKLNNLNVEKINNCITKKDLELIDKKINILAEFRNEFNNFKKEIKNIKNTLLLMDSSEINEKIEDLTSNKLSTTVYINTIKNLRTTIKGLKKNEKEMQNNLDILTINGDNINLKMIEMEESIKKQNLLLIKFQSNIEQNKTIQRNNDEENNDDSKDDNEENNDEENNDEENNDEENNNEENNNEENNDEKKIVNNIKELDEGGAQDINENTEVDEQKVKTDEESENSSGKQDIKTSTERPSWLNYKVIKPNKE